MAINQNFVASLFDGNIPELCLMDFVMEWFLQASQLCFRKYPSITSQKYLVFLF